MGKEDLEEGLEVYKTTEYLKGGNMKVYESNSGQDIIYLNHSSSGAAGVLTQSSADPISLMNLVRNSIFLNTSDPLAPSLNLTPDEEKLYLYNIQYHEEEPEDTILANSDISLKLLEQAKQEPPSNDWERELDELVFPTGAGVDQDEFIALSDAVYYHQIIARENFRKESAMPYEGHPEGYTGVMKEVIGGPTQVTSIEDEIVVSAKQGSATPQARAVNLHGMTYRKKTPVGTAYITINVSEDRIPFEVFINVGKAGSDVAADAEGLGRLISLILRLPGPTRFDQKVKDIVSQLRGIGSGRPQGFGPHRVMSLADAVAQAMAEHMGLDANERLPGLPDVGEGDRSPAFGIAGDLCPECGQATLVFEEGCKKCHGCGYSEC